jgi:hypothetical protein
MKFDGKIDNSNKPISIKGVKLIINSFAKRKAGLVFL